jgi:hypothetical protein
MSQSELAAKASISVPTLKRMEASIGLASGMTNNVAAVITALEIARSDFSRGEWGRAGRKAKKS